MYNDYIPLMYCPGLTTSSAVTFQEKVIGDIVVWGSTSCRGRMSKQASLGGPSGRAIQPATNTERKPQTPRMAILPF